MSLQKKIDREVQEVKKKYIEDLRTMTKAFTDTFKEDYGFGDIRMERLVGQLNTRLPEHLKLERKGVQNEGTDSR